MMDSPKFFRSEFGLLNKFATTVDNSAIKNEPMFFNSSLEYAYRNGGEITKSFIDALPQMFHSSDNIFDSRVHMLMPGWYPAIPGWHHDDVPRNTKTGQPNYDNPHYKAKHVMGLVGAEVCPTQFAIGSVTMKQVPDQDIIYKQWHPEVNQHIKDGNLKLKESPDRTLLYFDADTFHQGQAAKLNGWRWFGRVSIDTDRTKGVTNEIRRQCQVYLEFPLEGW